MLTPDILKALKGYTANIRNDVALVLQTGAHPKRDELKRFLEDFASVSDRIRLDERDLPERLRSPVSFLIEVDGADTGVVFSGIPGGHEFNSLVLALLHATGTPMKLDDGLKGIVKGIEGELRFETFVSLSCHNCPDIVQALNQFALLNPHISNEMIDGGVYPELVEERNIQGVPTVFLNGEIFANGKIDVATLVSRLMERQPQATNAEPAEALPLQDVAIVGGGPAQPGIKAIAQRGGAVGAHQPGGLPVQRGGAGIVLRHAKTVFIKHAQVAHRLGQPGLGRLFEQVGGGGVILRHPVATHIEQPQVVQRPWMTRGARPLVQRPRRCIILRHADAFLIQRRVGLILQQVEVGAGLQRAFFDDQYLEPGGAENFSGGAAACAAADDRDIGLQRQVILQSRAVVGFPAASETFAERVGNRHRTSLFLLFWVDQIFGGPGYPHCAHASGRLYQAISTSCSNELWP